MTYVAAVIADHPQNYWRLNEGAGSTAALDYGEQPGMLWQWHAVVSNTALFGPSGAGFGGITADGGSYNFGPFTLASPLNGGGIAGNQYVPFPDPGTLEAWVFNETSDSAVFIGWYSPGFPVNQQNFGIGAFDQQANVYCWTGPGQVGITTPKGQWHHVAMSWTGGTGFFYSDGAQRVPFTYPVSTGRTNVWFFVGDQLATQSGFNRQGLVTEVATYRRALTVGDLDVHFDQAELKLQRPHWLGQRQAAPAGSVTINHAYTTGVTHLARTGTGSFSVPTGLRGFKIDIIPPFPSGRVSAGTPTYLWDVGWVSLLNADGMLAEIRPNRDTRVWQPDNVELATVFTHDLLPGWTIDVTELDPA